MTPQTVSTQYLLIDAGNSQVKSLRARGRQLLLDSYARFNPDDSALTNDSALTALLSDAPDAIIIASVAAIDWRQRLQAQHRDSATPVHILRSTARHPLLQNAYPQPHTLGVDRWAAMLGARLSCPDQPCCVADLGTATTLDAIDAHGRHHGGWILPGLGTSRDSLQRKGHLLAPTRAANNPAGAPSSHGPVDDDLTQHSPFATDTASAIRTGTCHSQAAAILHFITHMQAQGMEQPRLFLTGGWAHSVLGLLSYEAVLDPYLVFRGMLAQFEHEAGGGGATDTCATDS